MTEHASGLSSGGPTTEGPFEFDIAWLATKTNLVSSRRLVLVNGVAMVFLAAGSLYAGVSGLRSSPDTAAWGIILGLFIFLPVANWMFYFLLVKLQPQAVKAIVSDQEVTLRYATGREQHFRLNKRWSGVVLRDARANTHDPDAIQLAMFGIPQTYVGAQVLDAILTVAETRKLKVSRDRYLNWTRITVDAAR